MKSKQTTVEPRVPYRLVGYTVGDAVPLRCNTCGQTLKYAWFLKDKSGSQFILGNDCLQRLLCADQFPSLPKDLERAKKRLNRWGNRCSS